MTSERHVSAYRWVILAAIVPIIVSTELLWLTLAPVSSLAEKFYGVGGMSISLLAMSYMIMFVIFTFPASWVIDRFGFRHSLIIGSVLTAVFGLTRALWADNFTIVLVSQFLIAIGQPFLLNISTKLPANWFPIEERATAAGILTMAQYIGFTIPMAASPVLAETVGIPALLTMSAVFALVSALMAIAFTREKPRHAPSGRETGHERFSLAVIGKLFSHKPFVLVLVISFISIGAFNTILSLIEAILVPRGIPSVQAGLAGAIFVLSGVVGAIVLPVISDRLHRKTPFFTGVIALLVPLYLVLTFAGSFPLIALAAGVAGFSIMGVAPILFQHGAETAYPVQEGTSLGTILLMGQISGALFVFVFELLRNATGSTLLPMLLIVALTAIELPFTLLMKDSKLSAKTS